MDICLIENSSGAHLRPESVHGILWLQTHFENEHWDALAARQIQLPIENAKELSQDAKKAGLSLNYISSLSIARHP